MLPFIKAQRCFLIALHFLSSSSSSSSSSAPSWSEVHSTAELTVILHERLGFLSYRLLQLISVLKARKLGVYAALLPFCLLWDPIDVLHCCVCAVMQI